MGDWPGPFDRSMRPEYETNTSAPSWVSNVMRTSSVHVMSGPIVAQSAPAVPFIVPDSRSPSSLAASTSMIVRMPLGVFGMTIGSFSVIVAVHNGTSSIAMRSVCMTHVERDQERLPPPPLEAPAVARLVLVEDETASSLGLLSRLDD